MKFQEFKNRYLNYKEEFLIRYNGKEYHLSFNEIEKKLIAEFNVGTPVDGYVNMEFNSCEELLRNARIEGQSIESLWDSLQVE